MKQIFFLILISPLTVIFSQNAALTTDVINQNGLVYYKGSPFSGELYEYNESAKAACNCTMKTIYKNGRINGKYESWYVSGGKSFTGSFLMGEKTGIHNFWTSNGNKMLEQHYLNDNLIEEKKYSYNGQLTSHIKYNPENSSELIYEKFVFDNGVIKEETHFKNKLKHGSYLKNYATGKAHKKIKYENGNEIEKYIYDINGLLVETLSQPINSDYFETKKFENGKLILKGYYSKNLKKDSVWTTFDNQNNKLKEVVYVSGKKIREGKYKNNLKEGIWRFYLEDGISQKNITYKSGIETKTKTFKVNHLFSNHFNSYDYVALLEFKNAKGRKENITLTSDQPFTKSTTNKYILGAIARAFLERMRLVNNNEINENTLISKKIHVSNIRVTYTSSNIKNKYGDGYITTYDAFIHFNLVMKDAGNNKIFSKSYKINRSGKLLNSILNNAAQTFSRTQNAAFISALKGIKFKKFFKKYFLIDKKKR